MGCVSGAGLLQAQSSAGREWCLRPSGAGSRERDPCPQTGAHSLTLVSGLTEGWRWGHSEI